MLVGWRVFAYINSTGRALSRCGMDVSGYARNLYAKDKSFTIYSGATTNIELIQTESEVEIRLQIWEKSATKHVVLERLACGDVQLDDRTLTFKQGISLVLYTPQDAAEAHAAVARTGPPGAPGHMALRRMSRLRGKPVDGWGEFLVEMRK